MKMGIYRLNNGRYIVARYDDRNGAYYAPMNKEEKRLTGCHTYTARWIEGLGVHSYSTRSAAKRWAVGQGYEINDE